MNDDYELVAAIDFGTTYSGYAYCSRNDFERSPLIIKTSSWKSGTGSSDKFMKTPTMVLFDSNGKFDSFGFEAEEKYRKQAVRNKHESWYFFRRFKMRLHQKQADRTHERLSVNSTVEDERGKQMKTLKVFKCSIKYLKESLIKVLIEQGMNSTEEVMRKTRWVLTVPAIWTDPAKEFMKKAAIEAGLPENKLLLALEPEAASLCCWTMRNASPDGRTILNPGVSYTVLDMGGGTADIVTHRIENDFKLREIHAPVGGDWGGSQVNSSFQGLLIRLLGAPIMSKFKNEKFFDYLEMMSDFEIQKQFISLDNDDEVMLKVPESLVNIFKAETGENLSEVIDQTDMRGQLEWTSGRLIVQPELFKTFFSVSIDNVLSKLKEMFRENCSRDVCTLLLVGGFSESPVLKRAIKGAFRDKRILIPEHPSLAILQGAVIYGHSPMTVKTRICKFTYGFMAVKTIDQHDSQVPQSRTILDGQCESGVFDKLVEIGQPVEVGRYQVEKTYTKVSPSQPSMILLMYTSTAKNPRYVTDDSCSLLGDLNISLPPGSDEVVVSTMFSDTYLTVKAVGRRSKHEVTATFDFLATA